MTKSILYSIELDDLLAAIRQIVAEEIRKKETESSEDRLYSTSETVKLFVPEISKQTLHAWTKAGLIPMQKLGGKNFYKYSDILKATKTLKRYKHHVQM
jgi:hypothetical protein